MTPGSPSLPCEMLRVVDRVEVGRSTRVTNQPLPGEADSERRQLGADLDAFSDSGFHASTSTRMLEGGLRCTDGLARLDLKCPLWPR